MFELTRQSDSSAPQERKRAAPVFVTGWKPRESLSAPVAETIPMATAIQKITLSSSRDIPFNKLVLSQSNVRRVKAADQARYEPDSGGGLPRHHR